MEMLSACLNFFSDSIRHEVPFHLCENFSKCIKAVCTQIRREAKVIKVVTSCGVSSLVDYPQMRQLSAMKLDSTEYTRSERIFAGHCYGKMGIMAALRAYYRTIEHESHLDQEAVDVILRMNAILVPTRSILEYDVQHAEAYKEDDQGKLVRVSEAHKESYKLAVKGGIHIVLGTDLGVRSPTMKFNHGMNGG